MKARCPWLVGLVIITGVGCAFYLNRRYYDLLVRSRYECPMRLTGLWLAIGAQRDGEGSYPTNLSFAAEAFTPSPSKKRLHLHPLLCSGTETEWGPPTKADQWSDYLYVNWSKWFPGSNAVPDGFPLVYDRRLSNHSEKGIYVLRTDGSILWDGGARWLRTFAEAHTNFQIPLPE